MERVDRGEPVAGSQAVNMSTQMLYDQWSATYDTAVNPTRDLEKAACERVLADIRFRTVIELGSGTGKNTAWLAERAERVVSVDLSEEMQAVAKAKLAGRNVEFRQRDVRQPWRFTTSADLVTCSLILEHVRDIDHIFREANKVMSAGGHFYICELHPFKQYSGSKARFETAEGVRTLECFQHHVTDYTNAAASNGFALERLDEWFDDDDDRSGIPRLISFVFSIGSRP